MERRDPFPAYCFKFTFDGPTEQSPSFFRSIGGLAYDTEVQDYQEGGQNGFAHRLVGTTKWPNIVLQRGFSKSHDLMVWRESWATGVGERRSGKIYQLNTDLKSVCWWAFKDGWPCKWKLSEFDASKNELSIETLEIAHHGLSFGT